MTDPGDLPKVKPGQRYIEADGADIEYERQVRRQVRCLAAHIVAYCQ